MSIALQIREIKEEAEVLSNKINVLCQNFRKHEAWYECYGVILKPAESRAVKETLGEMKLELFSYLKRNLYLADRISALINQQKTYMEQEAFN